MKLLRELTAMARTNAETAKMALEIERQEMANDDLRRRSGDAVEMSVEDAMAELKTVAGAVELARERWGTGDTAAPAPAIEQAVVESEQASAEAAAEPPPPDATA